MTALDVANRQAERERIAIAIALKMHRQPHAHAGFADGLETAVSCAQEIARNPDREVAPLAELVRQMRLKCGEPPNSPRDWFEDGRAAERDRWLAVLADHYLMDVVCDPGTEQDDPVCGCSRVFLGWHGSIGAARQAWIDHVRDVVTGGQT